MFIPINQTTSYKGEEYPLIGSATRGAGEPIIAIRPRDPDTIIVGAMANVHYVDDQKLLTSGGMGERERPRVLAALAATDAIVVFDSPTPIDLILALHPDVLVKGGDYKDKTVVGGAEVTSWGGRVVIVPSVENFSISGGGSMTRLDEIREVIHRLHGGKATHHESVPVTETFQGKTVWDGVVEVFHLDGHPKANKVYVWMHDPGKGKPPRHVTVLHIPPAVSPLDAVRAFIVQEFRNANE